MQYPLSIFTPQQQKRIFWISLGLTILVMMMMSVISAPLNTDDAPYGIISFELAGNLSNAQRILESWDELARQKAAFSLGFDFVFILLYSTTLGLGCILASRFLKKAKWPFSQIGYCLAWAQILAACLDGIENTSLILTLFGSLSLALPLVAWWCAILKFSLIFLGMVYAFLGVTAYFSSRGANRVA